MRKDKEEEGLRRREKLKCRKEKWESGEGGEKETVEDEKWGLYALYFSGILACSI